MQAEVSDTAKDVKPNCVIWEYGYDGTIVYVNRYYFGRFTKRVKKQHLAYFYTDRYDSVVDVANDYIERLTQ